MPLTRKVTTPKQRHANGNRQQSCSECRALSARTLLYCDPSNSLLYCRRCWEGYYNELPEDQHLVSTTTLVRCKVCDVSVPEGHRADHIANHAHQWRLAKAAAIEQTSAFVDETALVRPPPRIDDAEGHGDIEGPLTGNVNSSDATTIGCLKRMLGIDAPYFTLGETVPAALSAAVTSFYSDMRTLWLKHKVFAAEARNYSVARSMWLKAESVHEWLHFLKDRGADLAPKIRSKYRVPTMEKRLQQLLDWHSAESTDACTTVPLFSKPFDVAWLTDLMPISDGSLSTEFDKVDRREERQAAKAAKDEAAKALIIAKMNEAALKKAAKALARAAAKETKLESGSEAADSDATTVSDTDAEEEESVVEEADDYEEVQAPPATDGADAQKQASKARQAKSEKQQKAGLQLEKTSSTSASVSWFGRALLGLLRDPLSIDNAHHRLRSCLTTLHDDTISLQQIERWMSPVPEKADGAKDAPTLAVLTNVVLGSTVELDAVLVDLDPDLFTRARVLLVGEVKCNPADLGYARFQRGKLIRYVDNCARDPSLFSAEFRSSSVVNVVLTATSFDSWRVHPIGAWIYSTTLRPTFVLPSRFSDMAMKRLSADAGASGWSGKGPLPPLDQQVALEVHRQLVSQLASLKKGMNEPAKVVAEVSRIGSHLCAFKGSKKQMALDSEERQARRQAKQEKKALRKAARAAEAGVSVEELLAHDRAERMRKKVERKARKANQKAEKKLSSKSNAE